MIDELRRLISIPSVAEQGMPDAPYGQAVKEALEYVLQLCDSLGFRTKNCDDKVGWAEIGDGSEMIGILVHLDVVPAGEGWTHPPFEGKVIDEKLYGRGSLDDKGPAIACIYAMKDLLDEGEILKRRIRIIFGQTEEAGEWTDMEYYKKTEEIPVYGFTPDANFPAIHGEKGLAFYKFSMPYEKAGVRKISGGNAINMVPDSCNVIFPDKNGRLLAIERKGISAHGSMPELGENAITKVMQDIYILHAEKKVDCPLAAFYQETIGECIHGEKIGCALEDKESGKLTFNVGTIANNEQEVFIHADVRFPVTFSVDEVTGRLQEAVKPYGVTVSVEEYTRPVYMDKDGSVMHTLLGAYRDVTGDYSEPLVIGGASYARAMDNIIAFGPLLPGRESLEHQSDEYISLEDLNTIRQIYYLALKRLTT